MEHIIHSELVISSVKDLDTNRANALQYRIVVRCARTDDQHSRSRLARNTLMTSLTRCTKRQSFQSDETGGWAVVYFLLSPSASRLIVYHPRGHDLRCVDRDHVNATVV